MPGVTQWELGFIRFFLLVLALGWIAISTVERSSPTSTETEAGRGLRDRHRTPSSWDVDSEPTSDDEPADDSAD